MLVGNEYLPCLRQVTPQSMPVTTLDLLDLSLIGPNAPGIWAIWSLILTKKNGPVQSPESQVLRRQGVVLPSACGGMANPRSHLANEFHQIQFVNYYMSVTFFVILKSVKKY